MRYGWALADFCQNPTSPPPPLADFCHPRNRVFCAAHLPLEARLLPSRPNPVPGPSRVQESPKTHPS